MPTKLTYETDMLVVGIKEADPGLCVENQIESLGLSIAFLMDKYFSGNGECCFMVVKGLVSELFDLKVQFDADSDEAFTTVLEALDVLAKKTKKHFTPVPPT